MFLFKNNLLCRLMAVAMCIVVFATGAGLLYWLVYHEKSKSPYQETRCKILDLHVTNICDNNQCHDYINFTMQYTDTDNVNHTEFILLMPEPGQKFSVLLHRYPVNSTTECFYSAESQPRLRLDEYYSRTAYIGLSFSIIFFIIAGTGLICFAVILCDRYWFDY